MCGKWLTYGYARMRRRVRLPRPALPGGVTRTVTPRPKWVRTARDGCPPGYRVGSGTRVGRRPATERRGPLRSVLPTGAPMAKREAGSGELLRYGASASCATSSGEIHSFFTTVGPEAWRTRSSSTKGKHRKRRKHTEASDPMAGRPS